MADKFKELIAAAAVATAVYVSEGETDKEWYAETMSRLVPALAEAALQDLEEARRMGDRIGIVFATRVGRSDLYAQSHWGGRDLLVAAQEFIRSRNCDARTDPDELVRAFADWCTNSTWSPDSIEVRSHKEDGDYEDVEDNGVFTVDHEAYVYRARDPGPQTPSPFRGLGCFFGAGFPFGGPVPDFFFFFRGGECSMPTLHSITLIYPQVYGVYGDKKCASLRNI